MMVFHVAYALVLTRRDKRLNRRTKRFAGKIDEQLNHIKQGGQVGPIHVRYLRRRLSKITFLIAFEKAMEDYREKKGDSLVEEYCRQIGPTVIYLAGLYEKKDDMQAAYFAYFVSRHLVRGQKFVEAVADSMIHYMRKNVYCRINALQALYKFGSEESIAKAITLLDWEGLCFHDKILTDGLLNFTGSHERLIQLLWEKLNHYSDSIQLAILNYIRFQTGDYCEGIFKIMADTTRDKELRLSAIRYFGRYPYEPAKGMLLRFAADKDPRYWEYAAVSLSALAGYSGDEVIDVLMDAVHSSNWYIRFHAAASLEACGLSYSDVAQVTNGQDRYAREMIMYQLELKQMRDRRQPYGRTVASGF